MAATRPVTAALIIIGNEILSGRTQDANLPYLGEGLNQVGIQLAEARVVPDDEAVIVDAVNACRAAHDYVFTTGGIGPTHDDVTAAAVARAFGRRLVRNPEAERLLRAYYEETGREVTPARLKMAEMPEGAELVPNELSIAPGFRIENVIVMAGIPSVMRVMFEAVKASLAGGVPILSRTVRCRLPEGIVAPGLGALQERFSDLDFGSYPFYDEGRPGANLVVRGTAPERLEEALRELARLVVELGDTPIVDPTD